MDLRNKRVLITAGPTWVALDEARVISNTATGETGIVLAEKLRVQGARVTLVLGPTAIGLKDSKIRVVRFRFFDELKNIVVSELALRRYDVVIHASAVADYRPLKKRKNKIRSGLKVWNLALIPTVKIIDRIKKAAPQALLAGFKFEPRMGRKELVREAEKLAARSKAEIVVANTHNKNGYEAFVVYKGKIRGPVFNKTKLAETLLNVLREEI
ncbi:MAG: phosphopantothenoylcysteine decarboxylase [Candidatus Omnitrophota bacterium]